MAIYTVSVEVKVCTRDEPGDRYVDLPHPQYVQVASFRDHKKAVEAAEECVGRLIKFSQPKRQAARARPKKKGA
jgi:hypothetical protein